MATKINDASDFGVLDTSGRQVVRDSNGYIWVLVVDDANNDIELWRSIDGGSSFSEQDSGDSPETTVSQVACAMAIDSNDDIHVAYSTGTAIYYAKFSSGNWGTPEEVDGGGVGDIWNNFSIAVDSNNIPHIATVEENGVGTTEGITYYQKTSGSWSSLVGVAGRSAGDIFEKVSLAINAEDIPVIVTIHGNDADVDAYLGNQNAATSFTKSGTIDDSVSTTSGTAGCSIAVDSSGDVWVAYVDSDSSICLAKQSANWTDAWTTYDSGTTGYEPSLVIDGTDKYVFYTDASDNITYQKYDGSWSGENDLQTGTYQDVKARWALATQYDSTASSLVDSYSESNQDEDWTFSAVNVGVGQCFTGNGESLKSIDLYLKKTGTPSSVHIDIYAITGTYGTNATPTGSILATSETITASEISTSYGLVRFEFTGEDTITLTNGAKYFFVIEDGYNGPGNTISVGNDGSSPTHSGNMAQDGGGGYSASSADDLIFYVRSFTNITSSLRTYYFDASDAGPTDSSGISGDEADAFDGDDTSYAGAVGAGESGIISGEGTNAPASGGTIVGVKARVKAGFSGIGSYVYAYWREDTAESGTLLGSDESVTATDEWTDWVTLTAPSGGWTWAKVQSLAVDFDCNSGSGDFHIYKSEILVQTSDSPQEIDYLFSDGTDVYWDKLELTPPTLEISIDTVDSPVKIIG